MSVNLTQQGIFNASGDVNQNLFKTTPKSATTASYNAYQINMNENLTANTTYTVQLWDVNVTHAGKTTANIGVNLYWGGGNVSLVQWQGTAAFTNGHADYLVRTFTPTTAQAAGSGATNSWINVYNSVPYVASSMSLTIGKWKLEKGNIATPWMPSTADNIYVGSKCGFSELNKLSCEARIDNECIQATNFIEW